MSNPNILLILDCKHVQPGRVSTTELQCYNCNDHIMHRVIDVHVWEWYMKCESCKYSAWCGLSQILANQTANLHCRKWSRHTAKIHYVENPIALRAQKIIREGMNDRASSRA